MSARQVKNRNDLRFRRSEQGLCQSLYKELQRRNVNLQVTKICRNAGVRVPTFYSHYHNVNDALVQAERNMFKQFTATLRSSKQLSEQQAFLNLLIFVIKNQAYFKATFMRGNYRLLIKLVRELRPVIMQKWPHYKPADFEYLFMIYCAEVIAVIVYWYQQYKFNPRKIESCVQRLQALTHLPARSFRKSS